MLDQHAAGHKGELSAILEAIRSHDRFMITSHVNPDGDCISSQLAFRRLLMALGKTCCITSNHPVPRKYKFLPDSSAITREPPGFSPEVIAILDVGSRERMAWDRSLFESVPLIINVDHHPSNKRFGTWTFIDENACATCAIIYRMYQAVQVPIDCDVANQLFCGIMTDTGRFSFTNANAEAFSICADLMNKGARSDQIATEVYFKDSFSLAKVRGRVLSTLELSAGGKICSMVLSEDVAKRVKGDGLGDVGADTEGFADYTVWIRGVEVGIFIKWTSQDVVKVSFRSAGTVDVNKLASVFGGGGHRKAAGCTLAGSVLGAKNRVLAEAEQWLRK